MEWNPNQMDLQWKKKMDLQEDQLQLQAQSKGRLPSEQFPHAVQMLTDMIGAPATARNACDTVVNDVALAILRLGDQPSDLQRQPDYQGPGGPLRGG